MRTPSPVGIFLRSLALGIVLISLWTWFVPRAVGFHLRPDFAVAQTRTITGSVLFAAGFVLWVTCLLQFAFEGRGTLVPIDAPRHLVMGGLYRYVRNPMYLAVALLLFGEALALGDFNRYVVIYFSSLTVVTVVFVRFYEEPHLRKLFGPEYEDYCAHVRRWLPSLRPWHPRSESAHTTGHE